MVHFPSGNELPAGVEDANQKLQAWAKLAHARHVIFDALRRIDNGCDEAATEADEAAYTLKQLGYANMRLLEAMNALSAAYPRTYGSSPPAGFEYEKLFSEETSVGPLGRREGGDA